MDTCNLQIRCVADDARPLDGLLAGDMQKNIFVG
jgi:hypothetical protein